MDHIIYTSGVVHERFPAILIATTTYLNISYENSKQQNRYLWVRKIYLEVWAVPEQLLNFWLTSPSDSDTQLLYRCAALLKRRHCLFGSQIHPARQDGIDIWVHVDQICILRVLGGFCLQYFQNKFLKNIQLFKIKFLKKPWCCVGGRV